MADERPHIGTKAWRKWRMVLAGKRAALSNFDRAEYEARPHVCDCCGYRVYEPCTTPEHRRNCEN